MLVRWSGGTRSFVDKPPYDEPLDGLEWTYCSYNSLLHLHLIEKFYFDLFTGVLLDDKTGAVLPAGEMVLFSPDQRLYLAYEQEDGKDGEDLKLYSRSGTLLWRGYNGALSADGKTVIGSFSDLHWNSSNVLETVQKIFDSGKTTKLKLQQDRRGKWAWTP